MSSWRAIASSYAVRGWTWKARAAGAIADLLTFVAKMPEHKDGVGLRFASTIMSGRKWTALTNTVHERYVLVAIGRAVSVSMSLSGANAYGDDEEAKAQWLATLQWCARGLAFTGIL